MLVLALLVLVFVFAVVDDDDDDCPELGSTMTTVVVLDGLGWDEDE